MELDGIEVFVKVVQSGSFSRAAKALGMPNSTVSAKISALEKRLGATLLQRTTRKLHVTQAGQAYYKRCVLALEQLQAADAELTSGQREPRGELRVTAPVDIGHSLLVTLVRSYLQRYPKIRVDLTVTNRTVDLVAEGIDLAVRAGNLSDSRLIAKRFAIGHYGLWASAEYLKKYGTPAHPRELAQHQMLRFSHMKAAGVQLNNGKESSPVEFAGRVSADDLDTLKAFALLGEGIVYLPAYLCAKSADETPLQRVLPNWRGGMAAVSFVYPAQRFVPAKVRAFMTVAEETLNQ